MKLRTKVILISVLVSGLVLLLVLAMLVPRTREERLKLIDADMSRQLEHIDFAVAEFIKEKEDDVRALSNNELIRTQDDAAFTSFLNADEETFEYNIGALEQSIISVLNTYRINHPYVNSVYMGRENGRFVRSHPRTRPTQYDPRERPWYILAKENPTLVMRTAPYQSVTNPDVNIGVVTALVNDEGEMYGVIGADITLVNLTDYISDFDVGYEGQLLLFDEQGTILATREEDNLFNNIQTLFDVRADEITNKDRGFVVMEEEYVFFRTSPSLGWKIAVMIPSRAINQETINAFLYPLLALSLSLILFSVIALVSLNFYVIKPLEELSVLTQEITKTGDLNHLIMVRNEDELGVLAASFNQMVASIKDKEKEMTNYMEQLETLRRVSLHVTSSLDMQLVLDTVLEHTMHLVAADNAHIFLYGNDRLTFGAAYWAEESKQKPITEPRQDGITYKVAREGGVIVIPDIKQHPLYQNYDSYWVGSIVGLPLRSSDSVIGVMNIAYEEPHEFNENELRIMELLSDQAAVAIANATLHELTQNHADQLEEEVKLATKEIQKRANELATLYEVGKEITSTLDLGPMLQIIADDVANLVEADNSLILLIDAEKEKLKNAVGHGYSREQLIGHTFEEFQDGLSGWVLNKKEPTLSTDIQADQRNRGKALASAKRSGDGPVAIAPLLIENEVIGTLTVINKRQMRAFTRTDMNLVTMLAGQAAIAIQNAQLYEVAQEADRLKSAFLASMSHELRTPLNSIIGFTGMILDGLVGPLSDEQEKQLGMVFDSAEHLLNLINDVLDISKIEAGQIETSSESFNMQVVIEKVMQSIIPLVERKALAVVTEIAPEVGQITSDQRRVEQILINLVSNAIKFTDQGTVSIECQVDNGWLITRVADTGIGINSEDMDKLFKAFRQIDTGVARRYEGTGLGLSICKKLVEMLGGDIWVESEWGVGSTFSFTLPLLKE